MANTVELLQENDEDLPWVQLNRTMDSRMYWIIMGAVVFVFWPCYPFVTSPAVALMLFKPISQFNAVLAVLETGSVSHPIPDYLRKCVDASVASKLDELFSDEAELLEISGRI